ncbi:hypothetical protein [Streptomyces sp. JJ36]|uniref:hypothetical protein n=1 Tax=Streptomyces sp. JJ36 TaxID=2736645 RepID=UPI001F2472DB|nr:hypothetical protein [Streptomyces sp. JJ36]MCF6524429.1 hypothetical protein [Streptomyces sp. JJ36]
MKHGTMKTLGVTALGAAFAATGAGAAHAGGVTESVETAGGQVLANPAVQDATGKSGSIGRMPTRPEQVVSPGMAAETGQAATPQGELLGGLPVVGQVTGNALPTDVLTEGPLPTEDTKSGKGEKAGKSGKGEKAGKAKKGSAEKASAEDEAATEEAPQGLPVGTLAAGTFDRLGLPADPDTGTLHVPNLLGGLPLD